MKNLVLIDLDCVTNLSEFVLTLLPDTEYVTVGLGKKFSDVKALIPDTQYTNVALVQHNMKTLEYKMMMHDAQTIPARVCDVETIDPELSSWTEILDFLQWLRDTRGMQNFDLLACDIWADNDWKYIINKLKTRLQIGVRASVDVTGIDGNFVLESDNVDTIGLYFNEDVKKYPQNFFTQLNYRNLNTAPILDGSGGWYYKNKYASKLNDAFQATSDANYITLPYDVSNVVQVMGLTYPAGYGLNSYAVLRKDGSVVRWGHKVTAMFNETQVTDASLTNIKRLYGGRHTMIGLKNDGTVIGWGNIAYNIGNSSTLYTDTQFIKAIPADASNIQEIYVCNQAYWGVTTDKRIISWGARRDGGDTSLCDSLLVNIKKVAISNNLFIALREDNNIVLCGASDPGANIPCRYATTVGSAGWGGKIVDVYNGYFGYALVLNNGSYGIYRLQWGTTNVIANTNTMAFISTPLYTLPAGVTVLDTAFTATGSIILYLSNNTSVISYQNTFQTNNGYQTITNNANVDGWRNPNVYLSRDGAVITGNNLAGQGGSVYDPVSGIPAGADVASNVVRLYSASYNAFCALKANGSVVAWGINRYNSAAANIYDIVGVLELYYGFVFFRSDGSFYSITTGYSAGSIPAGKTLYMYEGGRVEGDGFIDTQVVELDIEESYSPSSVTAYIPTTITYKSNRWERMARRGVAYGLYAGNALVSTFVPTFDTYTYEFKNSIVPNGATTLTVGSGNVNFANTYFTFSMGVTDNPFVSAPDMVTINSITPVLATQRATINFTLPTWDGGLEINSIKYSINGGVSFTTASKISPLVINGLNQATYQLIIRAVNYAGDSGDAAETINMCNPPGTPTISSVTAGNRTISVVFTAPVSNGGSAITGYQYSLNGGAYLPIASTSSPLSLPNINNGASYTVNIKAVNIAGAGTASNTSALVTLAATAPVAPTINSVATSSGAANVNFTMNHNGGSAITALSYSLNGAAYVSAASLSSPLQLTGLTNGTSYTVAMRVTNALGTSSVTTSSAFTPVSVPVAPFLMLTSSGNSIVVTYSAESNSGTAITGYKYSLNGAAYVAPAASPFTLNGLTIGSTYTVRMIATNAVGDSLPASKTLKLTVIPSAPVITNISSSSNTGLIAFTQPATANSGNTLGYKYGYTELLVERALRFNFGMLNYVRVPSHSDLDLGTGDFTIEWWQYGHDSASVNPYVFSRSGAAGTLMRYYEAAYDSFTNLSYLALGSQVPVNGSYQDLSIWRHCSINRVSGVTKFYINGNESLSVNDTTNYSGNYDLYIGNHHNPIANDDYSGYIYGFTYVKGAALRTATFTPPRSQIKSVTAGTLVLSLTGTSALGTLASTIVKNNVSFVHYLPNGQGSIPTSVFLRSGRGASINVANHDDVNMGTGDFTIQFYLYLPMGNSYPTTITLFAKGTNMRLRLNWTTKKILFTRDGVESDMGTFKYGSAWPHFAICRTSGVTTIYMDGVSMIAFADTTNYTSADNIQMINDFGTYMGSFSMIKGFSMYKEPFVPIAAMITDAPDGATLALAFDGTKRYGTASANLSFVNTFANNIQTPPGFSNELNSFGFEAYYNRSFNAPAHSDLNFGTGDFTVEWWQRPNLGDTVTPRVFQLGSTNASTLAFYNTASVVGLVRNGTATTFSRNDMLNKWAHIAITRVSNVIRVFINGVSVIEVADNNNYVFENGLRIGSEHSQVWDTRYSGTLVGFAIVKGRGLYTSAFTPQRKQLAHIPSGILVLSMTYYTWLGTIAPTVTSYRLTLSGDAPVEYMFNQYEFTTKQTSPIQMVGLTNGTQYSVFMKTVSVAGDSYTSNLSASFVPITTPAAPVITDVVVGNASVALHFNAPTATGGAAISNYKLSINNGSYGLINSVTSPYTVTGLTNGSTYSFKLKAVNGAGDSPETDETASVIPYSLPDTPVVTILDSDQYVTVQFAAGASNGGSTIVSYTYTIDSNDPVTVSTPEDVSFNTVIGQTYTFSVYCTTEYGNSVTTTRTITGKSAPAAPTIDSVVAGNKSASVAFTLGETNYSNVVSMKYQLNSDGIWHTKSYANPLIITGLSENVEYSIVISAVNAVGASTSSNSMTVTPYTTPDVCVIDEIVTGNGVASVSFTAGASNGSDIVSFKYSVNNGTYVVLPDLTTSFSLSDLSNGIMYNLKIKATNVAGDSNAASSNFMPYTVPEAPFVTSVTAGNEQVDVYFTPGFFNGSNITGYKYALNNGSNLDGTAFVNASGINSPIHIDGLTNGTIYTVSIVAMNAAGESNASNISTSFTPFITQSTANPPLLQSAQVSNGSVSITYVDDFNPGSAIIGYKYSLNGGAYYWFAESSSPLTINDLVNGQEYTILVKSVNNSGPSSASLPLTFTPCGVPSAPVILNGVAGDGMVTIYLAELESNGSPITSVLCSLNDETYVEVDVSENQFTMSSLTNGETYVAKVKCVNELGESAESNVSETMKPVGLPYPPTITNVEVGNEMVTLSFDAADGNGEPILKYSYCLIANGVAGLYLSTEDLTSPIIITGLTNGVTYAIKMKSLTSVGESIASLESEDFVPYTLPSAPVITKATFSNNVLKIYFTETDLNGKSVTDHLYSLDGSIYYSSSQLTSPIDVSNLLIGSSTTVFIKTVTDAGASLASNESTSFIAYAPPVSPTITSVSALDRALSVQFTDGSFNGTNLIGYKYSIDATNYYWCNTTVSPILITGLTNGTSYTVSLKTVTDRGETDAHVFGSSVKPSSLQLPPNIINTDISNGSIIIEFTNPQLYGSTVTGYLYSLNDGDYVTATTVDTVNNKITITGLSNGISYYATIKSVSNQGTSLASNVSKTIKPYAAPSAPVISKVVTGSQIAHVHFTDGALNGSPAILGYKYSLDGVNYTWSSVTTSPIPLTGLTNSIAYTVRLVAVTSVNQSSPSAQSQTFIPFALPEAPTITSVTAGIGMATITFTAGATNGRPLTGYKYSVNGGALVSLGLVTSFTITGLEIGVPHYVTMYAVNAAGTSIASVPSQSFVPYNTPGAPVIESVSPLRNGMLVKVKNPLLNGTDFNNIPITGYSWSFDASSGFVTVSTENNASSFTISNLQNGSSYRIYVKSVTSIGTSPASAISSLVVPGDVPDAPTITSVTALDQKMMVYFTDGSNNGAEITGYKYTLDGLTYYTALQSTSPLTLFSLDNASSYTIQLKATNSMGDSAASNVSDSATPFGVPFAPVISEIIPGNGCAYVYFNPVDNNGSSILKFKYSLGSTIMDVSGLTSPLTIPNLVNKTVYNIVIIATNAAGDSYTSNIKSVIAGAPTAPVVTEVVPGAKNIKVFFTTPLDNGSPITQYSVTFDGIKFVKAPGLVSPITLGGLANGTSYNITLQAVNKNGVSKLSNTIPNQIPYDIPAKISITSVLPRYSSALVTFAPPLNNGSPITKYAYAMGADTTYTDISGLVPPLLIPGLPNNTSYTLKMIAYNAAGPSPVSAPSKAAIYIYTPPAQIKLKSIVAAKNSLIVDFLPPAANGAVITTYKYALNADTTYTNIQSTVVPFTITGLDNNTNYNIKLIATNEAGDSLPSVPAAKPVMFVFLAPAAPAVTSIVGGNQNGLIYFTAPKTNGAPVTGYKYSVDGGATKIDLVGSVSPLLVSGLTNDTTYNLLLYADSEAGLSPASAVKSFKPIYSAPEKPVIGTIISMNNGAFVTFAAGLENGSPITDYLYSLDAGVTKISLGSTNASFSLSGLINDTNYSLLMYAVNAVGTSLASAPKVFMPIYKVPIAPTIGTIATTANSASVSFTPGLANGAPISSYKYSIDNGATYTEVTSLAGPIVITGLTTKTTYNVRLIAVNEVGDSLPSAPKPFTTK
jgi:alpha-tubulin suppressor-like RCC1 family protein